MSSIAAPPVIADTALVWIMDLVDPDPSLLSNDEMERADRFVDRNARRRFIAARSLLRRLLAPIAGGQPHELVFTYGPQGKPRLVSPDRPIGFNLGHSEDQCIIAVAPFEVGADIEWAAPGIYEREAARLVMSPAELAAIDEDTDPDARFTALWVRKEAYAKQCGMGLDSQLTSITLLSGRAGPILVTDVDTGRPGLLAAVAHPDGTTVAVRAGDPEIR